MDTSTYDYKFRRREICEICETRVRYGYRHVHVLLRREGWEINMKRAHRIYIELGLQLRNKTPKRRVKAKLREDRCAASRANDVWAMREGGPTSVKLCARPATAVFRSLQSGR